MVELCNLYMHCFWAKIVLSLGSFVEYINWSLLRDTKFLLELEYQGSQSTLGRLVYMIPLYVKSSFHLLILDGCKESNELESCVYPGCVKDGHMTKTLTMDALST